MREDRMRNGRLEFYRSTRKASVETQIGHGLKSLFSDVLNEPLPPGILRALQTLEKLASEDRTDFRSDGDAMLKRENTERQLLTARRNAA